eukprot:gene32601-17621_t
MADLQRSTAAMKAGVQRSTATLSELATKWDKALGGFQGHIKKTATTLESELVKAVRGQVDDSQLLGLSYNWQEVRQSMPGDVDGLVVGWLRGDSRQQVVVVCEAKIALVNKHFEDAAYLLAWADMYASGRVPPNHNAITANIDGCRNAIDSA